MAHEKRNIPEAHRDADDRPGETAAQETLAVRTADALTSAWNRFVRALIPRVIGFDSRYQVGTPFLDQLGRKRHKQVIGVTYTFAIGWLGFLGWSESRWVPSCDLGGLHAMMKQLGPEGMKDPPLAWQEVDGLIFDHVVEYSRQYKGLPRPRMSVLDAASMADCLDKAGIKDRTGMVVQMEIRVRAKTSREKARMHRA